MRALLIICLFPFVEFCMGKGRTFCGDRQRLAATFAPLAASRACGCRERVGEKTCLPLRIRWKNTGRCDGRCSVLRWLMERAARAGGACSVSGCGKLLFPIGCACSPVLMCRRVACIARGKLALDGLRAMGIILPETLLRSSFFPAKVKKTCPIVLCYARLALPLQK